MFDETVRARSAAHFAQPIAEYIWQQKYQYWKLGHAIDRSLTDTWHRVSTGLSAPEKAADRARVKNDFEEALTNLHIIPAGRILSGCGTDRNVTLSNTFVMPTLPDSVSGIMDVISKAAMTMKMGGGIGFDFSPLRPKGMMVRGLDCPAAGPLAAMDICDSVCKLLVTGMGRGAMMATMRCDHPDIAEFVSAKSDRTRLRNFNMSVMITDAFMQAVADDADWHLMWDNKVVATIKAQDLWNQIMRQTYEAAEPGVLFIDRINDQNPLNYLETIAATNSCAEQPLPPNGTCPLAAINLARLVRLPFSGEAVFEIDRLKELTALAVRMLDNALDVSRFPLPEQAAEAQSKRRIGVGVTGVADALAMLGVRYGSDAAAALLGHWMRSIQNAAYAASAELAKERGAFAQFDAAKHMTQPAVLALDPDVRALIAAYGLRNGTLTTIAPTGTISMLAGNVSSGVEPMFATHYTRTITSDDGTKTQERVSDYAVWLYHQMFGADAPLPASFVTANDLSPRAHIKMQSAAQAWVDSGISKTVNCSADIAFDEFKDIYLDAYRNGCKGCTTYRPNAITGSVLSV